MENFTRELYSKKIESIFQNWKIAQLILLVSQKVGQEKKSQIEPKRKEIKKRRRRRKKYIYI